MERPFGEAATGSTVILIRLAAGNLRADVITYGAALRDIRHTARPHPLLLGLDSAADYERHSPHFGAIAGRCANRIAGARFELDGETFELTHKPGASHTLHGGAVGFGKRVWRVAHQADDEVTLALHSADGDQGFPGNLDITCRYRIEAPAKLSIELTATTDRATVVNLASHGYFNLDGAPTIDGHVLNIDADRYTPTDSDLIPTGETAPVEGSRYDLRTPTTMNGRAYDDNFCLADHRRTTPQHAATLSAAGMAMDVATTEPGLQLYTGDKVDCPVSGLDGRRYGARAGLCLEPQLWPNAPNEPGFPSAVLRPGERYQQASVFTFRLSS